MGEADGVRLRELRVLDGPNLYFTRPAIKLTLDVGPWLVLTDERARRLSRRAGIPSVATAGAPGSDQRRRLPGLFANERFSGFFQGRLLEDCRAKFEFRFGSAE